MNMRRSPGIVAGPDSLEAESTRSVGELMAAIAKIHIVVASVLVTMPDVDHGTRNRATIGSEN